MKNIDSILKQALTPTDEPDFWLNQKILTMAKEAAPMKKKNYKIAAVLASTAIILGIGSISIYAARKFLQPEHVAEKMKDTKLTDALQSKDAVIINETQSYGGYDVTLLSIVSGKDITEFAVTTEDGIHDDRTYAVIAIESSDQTPVPYEELSFFASPLIQGYNPVQYNAFTFSGGYFDVEEDGVLYRIAECDNIEIFADHEIYMCVSDSMSYNVEAYAYDETTGKISRNENYNGLNALFRLPLDSSKADPKAAKEYIQKIDEGPTDEPERAPSEEELEVSRFLEALTPENMLDYIKPIDSTTKVLTPDKEGYIKYDYNLENEGAGGTGTVSIKELFPDQKPGVCIAGSAYEDSLDTLLIDVFTLNEDGSVTYTVYMPK